jgi:hypothetical protein
MFLPVIFDRFSIFHFDQYRRHLFPDHWKVLLVADVIEDHVSEEEKEFIEFQMKNHFTSSSAFRTRLIVSSSCSINFIIL